MAVESDADRALFLSTDDFGTTATVTPAAGGGPVSIAGIFDKPVEREFVGEVPVSMRQPVFRCRTKDLEDASVAEADPFVIGAETFVATELQHDGTGITDVLLRLQ